MGADESQHHDDGECRVKRKLTHVDTRSLLSNVDSDGAKSSVTEALIVAVKRGCQYTDQQQAQRRKR